MKEEKKSTPVVVPTTETAFTESQLEASINYINPAFYPDLYIKPIYGSIEFLERKLMSMDDFRLDSGDAQTIKDAKSQTISGKTQKARLLGVGVNRDEVHASLDKGYLLNKVPPSVVNIFGRDYLCNGRTRHEKLLAQGKTNMIVDYYRADSWDEFNFLAVMSNRASEPESPHTQMDVKYYCDEAMKSGDLNLDWDEIKERVEAIVGGTFSAQKKNKMVSDIYHGDNLSSNFIAYDQDIGKDFLIKNGYQDNISNNGIYYTMLSTQFHSKALTTVAKEYDKLVSAGKPVKELRVCIQTGVLDGLDPVESWKKRIDLFVQKWHLQKNQMRQAWFTTNAKEKNNIILFGATPACVELAYKFPTNKLVLFNKGILADYSFAELDENFNPKND
jgi:hypothetical protein